MTSAKSALFNLGGTIMKKAGMVVFFALAGSWVLGCVSNSQLVKNDMPPATPTPTVLMTAAATATSTATSTTTETPVPVPARPVLPQARHFHGNKAPVTAHQPAPSQKAPKEAVVVSSAPAGAVAPTALSVAHSMATATTVMAAATQEAALPASALGQVQSGTAAGASWTPTPVVDFTRAGVTHTPLSISKLFMGLGLLILFVGILYALRQLQDSRRTSRSMQAALRAPLDEAKRGASQLPSTAPARPAASAPSGESEPERRQGTSATTAGAAPSQPEVSPAPAKPAPRRRKAAGTKTPKKAALRAARPAVKTVRLGRKTTAKASTRKRRPSA
jgi:hypothetical protein